jgi:mono/diheme cytochrome c family protein
MARVLSWLGRWGLALVAPGLLFVVVPVTLCVWPKWPCGPLALDLDLTSEASIPVDPPAAKGAAHVFRDLPTGTEFKSGVPYWIFRALPRVFPERFEGFPKDAPYARFGLMPTSPPRPSGLPQGMVMADSDLQLPGVRVGLKLKRVAFNCAGCHTGQYYKDDGSLVTWVDGMPNHVADTQAYKRFIYDCVSDPRFTPDNLIAAIDQLLTEAGKPKLTVKEELVYTALVLAMADPNARTSWMNSRPDNGPGRIDAFDAVKYETLHVKDDGQNATVDLPSIWNQGTLWRQRHHWDGNTDDLHARNYGSVVGVGGSAMSVRGDNVDVVGGWIDEDLRPPRFPFTRKHATDATIAHGKELFAAECAGCHGLYDRETRALMTVPGSTLGQVTDMGTDPRRWQAFDAATADALNRWGVKLGIWRSDSFKGGAKGYLNAPLDGIWARAPYLHNGSVPSLRALLSPPEARPKEFYRGNRHYDPDAMGWVSDQPLEDGKRPLFRYDTSKDGNGNGGHPSKITKPEDIEDLLDYLASL